MLEGVQALTNLRFYYDTTRLATMAHILTLLEFPDCLTVEQQYTYPETLSEAIWNNLKHRSTETSLNPFLVNTLTIWYRCKNQLSPGISKLTTFVHQDCFPTGKDPWLIQICRNFQVTD